MKKIILLFYLFNFFLCMSQVDKISIAYKFQVKEFELPNKEADSYLKKYFEEKVKNYNKISEFLTINATSNGAEYSVNFSDYLNSDNIDERDIYSLKSLILPLYPIYYRDGVTFSNTSVFTDFIIKIKSSDFLSWEVTKNTKNILGYKCYKAIPIIKENVNKREANIIPKSIWFTPELNIKIAPGHFGNLPGAVLMAKYKNYDIISIEIKNTEQNVFKIRKKQSQKIISYKMLNQEIEKVFK